MLLAHIVDVLSCHSAALIHLSLGQDLGPTEADRKTEDIFSDPKLSLSYKVAALSQISTALGHHTEEMGCVCGQAFNGMAKRAQLKKTMAHHERGLFIALDAENAALARALEQIRIELQLPRSAAQPRFAGAAAAAARLTRRATATWDAMQVSVTPVISK